MKDLTICQVTESIPYTVGNGETHNVFKQEGEKTIKFLFQKDHLRGRVKTGLEGRWENGRDHLGWNLSFIRGKETEGERSQIHFRRQDFAITLDVTGKREKSKTLPMVSSLGNQILRTSI